MSGRKGKRSRQGDAVARRVRKDNAAGKRLRDIGTGSAGGSGGA